LLSVTVVIFVAIAVSGVPFSDDFCISPHRHCCHRRCLCRLTAAIAVAIAATAAIAFAITAATVITAAINATAIVALLWLLPTTVTTAVVGTAAVVTTVVWRCPRCHCDCSHHYHCHRYQPKLPPHLPLLLPPSLPQP
jgi:hypothetical protein